MLLIGNSIVFILLSTGVYTLTAELSHSVGPNPTGQVGPIPDITTNAPSDDVKSTVTTSIPNSLVPSNPKTTSSTIPPTSKPTILPTTSSTTVVPTTIPTNPPTTIPTTSPTTPEPAPTSPPKIVGWIVKENGTVCIIANMVMKINVPYKTTGNNKTVDAEFKIENLEDANANGTCGKESQTLVLTSKNVTAIFNFVQNSTEKTYLLNTIQLNIVVNNYTFPNNSMVNVTTITLKHENQVFSVPMNHSYSCASVEPLSLNGTVALNETMTGSITVSNIHVEAFGTKKEAKYSDSMDCAGTQTPDIVPIAVGLILAGLVIVVLIAYLVGRRRAQARGYLSM